MATTKKRKLNGPQWVKPRQDPLVKDTAHMIKTGDLDVSDILAKTPLCRQTVENVLHRKTLQPQPTTLRLIARCYGKELVYRDIGSNE